MVRLAYASGGANREPGRVRYSRGGRGFFLSGRLTVLPYPREAS